MQLDPRLMLKLAASYHQLNTKQIHLHEFLFDLLKTLFGDAVNIEKEDLWKIETLITGKEKFYCLRELKMLLSEYESEHRALSIHSAKGFMEFLERKRKS